MTDPHDAYMYNIYMSELKVHLRINSDPSGVASYYSDLFGAKIIKQSEFHNNIKIYGNTFIINNGDDNVGEYIFKFDTMDEFVINVNAIKQHDIKIVYEPTTYEWGTTLFKFIDKYGINWVFEASAK